MASNVFKMILLKHEQNAKLQLWGTKPIKKYFKSFLQAEQSPPHHHHHHLKEKKGKTGSSLFS